MAYRLFLLLWGEDFIARWAAWARPSLLTPGNLPALAENGPPSLDVYTDRSSQAALGAALAPLAGLMETRMHFLDDMRAQGRPLMEHAARLRPPEFKYEIQAVCARHFIDGALAEGSPATIFLDSNFILGDGTLAAVDARRRAGARAVLVSVSRIETEAASHALDGLFAHDRAPGPRALARVTLDHPHPASAAFFVDSPCFTPYPSQLFWRVGTDGILIHAFIPHPLMVVAAAPMRQFQSTPDYDMALRAAPDTAIHLAGDSDDMLLCKFSSAEHLGERQAGPPPSPVNLALFALAATHHRHRTLARKPIRIHAGHIDPASWREAEAEAQRLFEAMDERIRFIAANAGRLDAKFLFHLKSHLGPIEDYLSPQVEPAELARLAGLAGEGNHAA